LLKDQGYATGQFGKNHLGDLNKFLPTVHGFDEFYGNLYHLNAEEEPEMDNYPSKKEFPKFHEQFGPRGVIHSWATDKNDPTEMPRWGTVESRRRVHAISSSTSVMMAMCLAFDTTTGNWSLWSNAVMARCRFGRNRLRDCAYPNFLT
jgi:arylsulfatase